MQGEGLVTEAMEKLKEENSYESAKFRNYLKKHQWRIPFKVAIGA
jgi:hypothetical protein